MTVAVLLIAALLSGCTLMRASNRLAILEERMDLPAEETLTLDARTHGLPREVEALKASVEVLDRELWGRQAKVASDLTLVRDETFARFTRELERVGHAVQLLEQQVDDLKAVRLREPDEKRASASLELPGDLDVQLKELHDEIALLKYTTTGLKTLLDQTQADGVQAFASQTAWLATLSTQLERYHQQALKMQSVLAPLGSSLH